MSPQPFFLYWLIFSSLIFTKSMGLLGRGISQLQGRYLHTNTEETHRNPWLEWDSNTRSKCSNERKTVHAVDRAATVMG
jgi:hypothetical protein